MNTQTHILLGATLLAWPGRPLRNAAILAGGLVPDISIFVMWASAKLAGTPESVIWRDLYWRAEWQSAAAVTNSVPLYLALALAATGLGARLKPLTPPAAGARPGWPGQGSGLDWRVAILVFSLAAMVHVATDLPVHVHDGHPAFWPFSNWVFQSPVSYWDPRYFGKYVSLVELGLAASMIAILWRRFSSPAVRGVLMLAAVSYVIVAHHWATSVG